MVAGLKPREKTRRRTHAQRGTACFISHATSLRALCECSVFYKLGHEILPLSLWLLLGGRPFKCCSLLLFALGEERVMNMLRVYPLWS
jgi:hypothetical protein